MFCAYVSRPLSAGGESSKTLSAGRDSPSCGSHLDRGESSDDSTVISSQTSTLTRNQGNLGCLSKLNLAFTRNQDCLFELNLATFN